MASGADKRVEGGPAFSGDAPGTPMGPDADTAARDGRFELREALRTITTLDRLKDCGLSVLAGGVTPVIRNGRAGYAGVVTCGSVHVCPCCMTSVRRVRQEELDQVGQFWECQSCGLVMMTLTMRHFERQPLALLADQQRAAWKRAFGQNAGRDWRAAKASFGIRGYIRAWEVTHGTNGWHAHYHVLLFLDRPLATDRLADLQALAFAAWSTALVAVGAYMPTETGADGKPVAVKIDAPDRGESGTLARYLMKGQDGKTRWGVAAELTRQDVKAGQGGHRTPMEIARAAVQGDDPDEVLAAVALWREYEQVSSGIRSLYWSNGLRKLLKEMGFELDDRTDEKVAADEAAEGTRLAMIPAQVWYRHIAHHKGRALALLKAAERGGTMAVRALVGSWGLIWGADVHPAETFDSPGILPTADEVLRRAERAELAARAEVWRTAFAAASLAEVRERAGAFAADPQAPEYAARARVLQQADADRAAQLDIEERERAAATPAAAEYARRRRATAAERADAVAASLARVREPGHEAAPRISLRKTRRATPVPAPTLTRPPAEAASTTCRRCGGPLATVLQPYGQHVGDCTNSR